MIKVKKMGKKKGMPVQPKNSETKPVMIQKILSQDTQPSLSQALAPIAEHSKYVIAKSWLSDKQLIKILQKTPREHVYTRKGKGGQEWDYVTGTYIEKVLNFVFAWNWDYEIISQTLVGSKGAEQVITLGKLTVKDDLGHQISKSQNGRKDVAYKKDGSGYLDLGNDYKASSTDCLKKCASLLGIASDIYGKQEFREITTDKQTVQSSVNVSVEEKPQVQIVQPKMNYFVEIANLMIANQIKNPAMLYKQLGIQHLISDVMTQSDYYQASAKLKQYFNGQRN